MSMCGWIYISIPMCSVCVCVCMPYLRVKKKKPQAPPFKRLTVYHCIWPREWWCYMHYSEQRWIINSTRWINNTVFRMVVRNWALTTAFVFCFRWSSWATRVGGAITDFPFHHYHHLFLSLYKLFSILLVWNQVQCDELLLPIWCWELQTTRVVKREGWMCVCALCWVGRILTNAK